MSGASPGRRSGTGIVAPRITSGVESSVSGRAANRTPFTVLPEDGVTLCSPGVSTMSTPSQLGRKLAADPPLPGGQGMQEAKRCVQSARLAKDGYRNEYGHYLLSLLEHAGTPGDHDL